MFFGKVPFRFGDFSWICSRASFTFCPSLKRPDPECFSRNISIGNYLLFQPAVLVIDIAAMVMTSIMIYHIKSKYTAVGRKEMVIFFYLYFMAVLLDFLLISNIVPFTSAAYSYVVAGHMAVVTSAVAILFLNGFVGFQWLEDGTWVSVWIFRIMSLLVFGGVYFVALATFNGIAGMSPSNSLALYIIYLIFNPAAIFLYFILQLVLVTCSLEDRWPVGDLIFGAFFALSGVSVLLVFSNELCYLASHYIDGMFLGSLFILLAVMMVYKYWDSITAEDMEFCVGGAPHIWHLSNTMELAGAKELPYSPLQSAKNKSHSKSGDLGVSAMRKRVGLGSLAFLTWLGLTICVYFLSGSHKFGSIQNGMSAADGNRRDKKPLASPFWFVQVSDLHINKFHPENGQKNFIEFLDKSLPMIKPAFVAATGDITDAKSQHEFVSEQYEEEWRWYWDQLVRRKLDRKEFWFDLRGNHDCFNVGSEKGNYFPNYSVQKETSYVRHLDEYSVSLIAIDGCPRYGLPKPYNFFGSLDTDRMNQMQKHIDESRSSNYRILLGHYPTVTLQMAKTTDGRTFADLTKYVDAYLTGHLHRFLFGLGSTIKAIQPNGLLDFEVADLKDHRAFRIGIADKSGLLSFHDTSLNEETIICITSPPDRRQQLSPSPFNEVRVFVFSGKDSPLNVRAKIGSTEIELSRDSDVENIWSGSYIDEISEGEVIAEVELDSGKKISATQPFSSLKLKKFGSFGEFLLLTDFRRLTVWTFAIIYLFSFALLTLIYFYTNFRLERKARWLHDMREKLYNEDQVLQRWTWHRRCFYRLALVGNNRRLCMRTLFILGYLTVGPWFFGPLTNGRSIGAVFLFGLFQYGHGWSIILDTWFYALVHLVQFILPGLLVLAFFSDGHGIGTMIEEKKEEESETKDEGEEPPVAKRKRPWYHSLFAYALGLTWYIANLAKISLLMANYGFIAWLTSPVYTWYTVWFTYEACRLVLGSRRQY